MIKMIEIKDGHSILEMLLMLSFSQGERLIESSFQMLFIAFSKVLP